MKFSRISSVILIACSCIYLTACHKDSLGITPSEPLQLTITDQPQSRTKPLVIVDGVEIEDITKNRLNPDDIKSITVLKANSTPNLVATYGPKASNGVILVNTKARK